jgi:hypothetical protein
VPVGLQKLQLLQVESASFSLHTNVQYNYLRILRPNASDLVTQAVCTNNYTCEGQLALPSLNYQAEISVVCVFCGPILFHISKGIAANNTPCVNKRRGQDTFSSPNRPHWHCCPSSLLVNGYRGSLPGVKRPRREVCYSPTSRAEVKNEWRYTFTPLYLFMEWTAKTLRFTLFTVKIMPKTNTKHTDKWVKCYSKMNLRFAIFESSSSIEVKHEWSCTSIPPFTFMTCIRATLLHLNMGTGFLYSKQSATLLFRLFVQSWVVDFVPTYQFCVT